MLVVSWRLFACRRPISSWMLTSVSEGMCLSSSIFASSSAIGCSKSRNATAMVEGGYGRAAPRASTPVIGQSASVGGKRWAGGRGWRAVHHVYAAATDEPFELLEQLAARTHAPLVAERQRAAGARARIFDSDRAWAGTPWRQHLGQPGEQRRGVGARRAPENQAPCLLFTHFVELGNAARGQTPGVAELIEAQHALDQHQRILGDEVTVLLVGLLQQCDLDPACAVLQCQDHARAALLELIDEPGDRDGLAACEATRLQAGDGLVAHQI